jgi:hypothetical protein
VHVLLLMRGAGSGAAGGDEVPRSWQLTRR